MFRIDFERSKFFDKAPLFGLLLTFSISFIPMDREFKAIFLLIAMFANFGCIFLTGSLAKMLATKYIPIKARIIPWNIEKTFFCLKPVGMISSSYDKERDIYTTPFKLAQKTYLPKVGWIYGLEILHRRPFDDRNLGSEAYIIFMGSEITHSRVILAEFWIPYQRKYVRVDHMKKIIQFEMAVGSEDYWIALKNRMLGKAGFLEINLVD